MSKPTITPDEQRKLLNDSIHNVKQQIQLMKKCLDESPSRKLMDALKHCSNFLSELRTNYLTPKQYYELYILIFDGLDYLSNYLLKNSYNNHLSDLYELVQYAGNIIPRLYLMITVGSVYMSTSNSPVKEIMKDMIEMCRGVQHPIRGLFLRYYLSQRIKNLLPLDNEEDLQESIEFLTTNFIEMNKLWVRLQHQGHSSERAIRLKERKELQILVGSNLVRLSQIDNIDKEYYSSKILPLIFEQIVQCRDNLAQEYLIDVVIQIFPDEFHLYTLDTFLETTLQLNNEVSIGKLLITMIDRFINYRQREDVDINKLKIEDEETKDATTEEGERKPEEEKVEEPKIDLFKKFWDFISKLDEYKPDISVEEVSKILEYILKLCLVYYPDEYSNINEIYKFAGSKIEEDSNLESNWLNLLLQPIKLYSSVKDLLNLNEFLSLYNKLSTQSQKKISLEILNKTLQDGELFTNEEEIAGLFDLLVVLITTTDSLTTAKKLGLNNTNNSLLFGSGTNDESSDSLEFILEQELFTKLLHLVYNKNPTINMKLLNLVKKNYLSLSKRNLKYTYPTLIFKMLYNLRRLSYNNANQKNDLMITSNLKNLSVIINELYLNHPSKSDLVLKLYLNAGELADQLKEESIAYEFFTQAFIVYEENISESKAQFQAILIVANKLHTSRNFSKENYENLITKTTLYGSKLLKKPDQCRAVYACSHLWWWCEIAQLGEEEGKTEFYRDNKRVLECLQKALRVADSCMDNQVSIELFIEILNRCLYYFIHGNELVNVKYINGLIELVKTNLSNLNQNGSSIVGDSDSDNNPAKHFARTLDYINDQKEIDERFQQIVC